MKNLGGLLLRTPYRFLPKWVVALLIFASLMVLISFWGIEHRLDDELNLFSRESLKIALSLSIGHSTALYSLLGLLSLPPIYLTFRMLQLLSLSGRNGDIILYEQGLMLPIDMTGKSKSIDILYNQIMEVLVYDHADNLKSNMHISIQVSNGFLTIYKQGLVREKNFHKIKDILKQKVSSYHEGVYSKGGV